MAISTTKIRLTDLRICQGKLGKGNKKSHPNTSCSRKYQWLEPSTATIPPLFADSAKPSQFTFTHLKNMRRYVTKFSIHWKLWGSQTEEVIHNWRILCRVLYTSQVLSAAITLPVHYLAKYRGRNSKLHSSVICEGWVRLVKPHLFLYIF